MGFWDSGVLGVEDEGNLCPEQGTWASPVSARSPRRTFSGVFRRLMDSVGTFICYWGLGRTDQGIRAIQTPKNETLNRR